MKPVEPSAPPEEGRHGVRAARWLWPALLAALVSAILVSTPSAEATSSAGQTGAAPALTTISTSYFESRLFARTNARRVAHGCRPLRQNAALGLAARQHSALMSYQSDLSHRLAGEADLSVRAVAAGYTNWRILAENLAWGQPTPRAMFRAWVRSPDHRANLDNCRLRDVGIAVVYRDGLPWATSDFGRHF